jgi:hypothetical protein
VQPWAGAGAGPSVEQAVLGCSAKLWKCGPGKEKNGLGHAGRRKKGGEGKSSGPAGCFWPKTA